MDTEIVFPFNGDSEVERIYDLDEVKTYNFHAIVGYTESEVYDLADTQFNIPSHPVPVGSDESMNTIGYATLFIKNNAIIASVSLDYSTPERLSIEANTQPLYLHMRGDFWLKSNLGEIDLQKKVGVSMILVDALVISGKRPADHRIQTLGTPVLL